VLVIDDLGCGALVDLRAYGLPHEPTVQESIAAGADLACFSGDKLIGGPQCGIIVGRKALIEIIKKHPLTRMLRVGKLTDIALERTLRLFLDPGKLLIENPTLRMLALPADAIRRRALRIQRRLAKAKTSLQVRVAQSVSSTGGGSLPGFDLPTWALALRSKALSSERLCARLRLNEPPIIARIKDDGVLLDVRTLLEGDDVAIVEALLRIGERRSDSLSRSGQNAPC
jgi:L-seryl-tRNA(Ser) seleniumtransferase